MTPARAAIVPTLTRPALRTRQATACGDEPIGLGACESIAQRGAHNRHSRLIVWRGGKLFPEVRRHGTPQIGELHRTIAHGSHRMRQEPVRASGPEPHAHRVGAAGRQHGQRRRQHSDDEAGWLGCEEAVTRDGKESIAEMAHELHAAVGQDALLSLCLAALCRGGAEKPDALDQRIERRRDVHFAVAHVTVRAPDRREA